MLCCSVQGILAIKTAEAEGLQKLMACSSDPELVKFYLALEKGLFNDVAGKCHLQLRSDIPFPSEHLQVPVTWLHDCSYQTSCA